MKLLNMDQNLQTKNTFDLKILFPILSKFKWLVTINIENV